MIIAKKKNNSVPRMYLRCTDKMPISVGRWNVKVILAALLIHFLLILHCALKSNTNPGYLRSKLFYY